MNSPASIAEASADWHERRERIYRWMADNGLPSYADLLLQVSQKHLRWHYRSKPRNLKAGELLHRPPSLPHAVKATPAFSTPVTLSSLETHDCSPLC